jgi:hypothetical protein
MSHSGSKRRGMCGNLSWRCGLPISKLLNEYINKNVNE